MRISSQMEKASATYAYVAIGSWCERTGFEGGAVFFFEQATEENTHLLKFIHYFNGAGAEAIIPGIEKPQGSFTTLESTLQAGLKSEQFQSSLTI